MAVQIVPIEVKHIESFRRALDQVARERKYLAMLEAPPLKKSAPSSWIILPIVILNSSPSMMTSWWGGAMCCRRNGPFTAIAVCSV
jgi:hypothetical protein